MNDQARLILSAYRPGGQDAGDPAFAEALEQARRDPAVAQWLSEQQQFDLALTEKLREVPVPASLRSTILAGARASRPPQWWAQSKVWALAAAVAVLAGIAAFWSQSGTRTPALAVWQEHALTVLDDVEASRTEFDQTHDEPAQLLAWLREHAAPTPAALPASLRNRRTFGCKTWLWKGRRLSLVCFDLGSGAEAHLVTIDRTQLYGAPPEGPPIFATKDKWSVAAWSEGRVACMLIGNRGPDALKSLLAAAPPANPLPLAALAR